jgi:hypothetical protein
MHPRPPSSSLSKDISRAQHCLPWQLEPGYDTHIDFSGLTSQICGLEQQHLILQVAHWIDANATWLQSEEFSLERDLFPGNVGPRMLAHNSSLIEELLSRSHKLDPACHAPVAELVRTLNHPSLAHQWEFIVELIYDLNAVRWRTQQARCVLVEALEDFVDDGEHFLQVHHAWSQTQSLQAHTMPVCAEQARARL